MFKKSTMDHTDQFDLGTVEGTRAYMAHRKERDKLLFTQAEPNSMKYYISSYEGDDSIIDVYPFLKALKMHEPKEVIAEIDIAMEDLMLYYTEGAGEGTKGSGYRLMIMRAMRNAIMSGMGYFTFDKYLEEKEEKKPEMEAA